MSAPEILAYTILKKDEARDSLEVGDTGDEVNTMLAVINGVTSAFESYVGRHFMTRTTTEETFAGDGTNRYEVNNSPEVTSIVDGSVYTSVDNGDTWTQVPDASVKFSPSGEVFLDDGYYFPRGFQNCKLSYVSGFKRQGDTSPSNAKDLPDELRVAALIYLKHLWKTMRAKGAREASTSFDGQTVTYRVEDMPVEAKAILKKYREARFG